jgi:hypothetical protein
MSITKQASGDAAVAMPPGEPVYEYEIQVVQTVEYGMSADSVLSGRDAPPPEGARFDLYLEGSVGGPRVRGTVKGVDYIRVRADGRMELHIHAEITTEQGAKVALEAGGIAIGRPGSAVFDLREHVALTSNHPELSWVNALEIWAAGTVDMSTGHVHVKGSSV